MNSCFVSATSIGRKRHFDLVMDSVPAASGDAGASLYLFWAIAQTNKRMFLFRKQRNELTVLE